MVVSNLRHPEKLVEPLKELGRRHESYHVRPEQTVFTTTLSDISFLVNIKHFVRLSLIKRDEP
jgi:hypothetical protein